VCPQAAAHLCTAPLGGGPEWPSASDACVHTGALQKTHFVRRARLSNSFSLCSSPVSPAPPFGTLECPPPHTQLWDRMIQDTVLSSPCDISKVRSLQISVWKMLLQSTSSLLYTFLDWHQGKRKPAEPPCSLQGWPGRRHRHTDRSIQQSPGNPFPHSGHRGT
jgi:hypothetical protein